MKFAITADFPFVQGMEPSLASPFASTVFVLTAVQAVRTFADDAFATYGTPVTLIGFAGRSLGR